MSSFQKRLSLMMKGDLDKTLFVLLDKTCEDYIDEESFKKLLDILENKSSKYTRIEGLEALLKAAKEQNKWQGALKVLMIFHKLIHSIGGEFLQYYSSNKIANIAKFEVDKSSLKGLVYSAIVPNYYNYLQKLSYNYDDLKTCFSSKPNFSARLNENKLSLLHLLSKVQNILLYLFKLFPLLETAFEKYQGTGQIKQLTYFCLTDAAYFYTYVNELISSMLREIFHLVEDDAIFLYELYSEHIQITKQIAKFFELKNYLPEFSFKLPEFYSLDVNFNREVELYILSLKKNLSSNHGVRTTTNSDIGSIDLGQTNEDKRSSRKPLTPFNDVLKTLHSTSATMPNLRPTSKQLFKPPVISKNNKGHNQIPQVKFYRADTEKEEEKGSQNEFDKSKQHFLKLPSSVRKAEPSPTESNKNLENHDPVESSLLSINSSHSNQSLESYVVG